MPPHQSYRYRVVDVFTRVPFEGNPLAVFPDAGDLDPVTMQHIANELNLSETVFLSRPSRSDCVAKLRIFTPKKEMDFAGHPTIGASFILLDQGLVPAGTTKFAVEENLGPIAVTVDGGGDPMIWLTTPKITEGPVIDRTKAAKLIQLQPADLCDAPPQILDAGNPGLFIAVRDKTLLDSAALDNSAWSDFKRSFPKPMCVFLFAPTAEGAYSRMFGPDFGIAEDSASGSMTGPLAAFMTKHDLVRVSGDRTRFQSEQGTRMGRRSILHIKMPGGQSTEGIAIGGHVTPIMEGTLTF